MKSQPIKHQRQETSTARCGAAEANRSVAVWNSDPARHPIWLAKRFCGVVRGRQHDPARGRIHGSGRLPGWHGLPAHLWLARPASRWRFGFSFV